MKIPPDRPSLQELLEFPCDYQFKAFGGNEGEGDFAAEVYRAVNDVLPLPLDAMKSRASAQGNYLCVTVLTRVGSLEQIEAVYAALRRLDGLKFLL